MEFAARSALAPNQFDDPEDTAKILKHICVMKLTATSDVEHLKGLLSPYMQQLDEFVESIHSTEPSAEGLEALFARVDSLKDQARLLLNAEDLLLLERIHWNNVPEVLIFVGHRFELPHLTRGSRNHGWDIPALQTFSVRSKNYLETNEKVLSEKPLFHLRGMQIVRADTLVSNIAAAPWSLLPKYCQTNQWLILNYMIPGASNVHIISYYTAGQEALQALSADSAEVGGWQHLLRGFWSAEKEFCDQRFKMLPSIIAGPWAAKVAVGNKPALTGTKLEQKYIKGSNHLEVDIDISSSSIAAGILRLVRGLSSSVTIDLGVVIQGETGEELPERVLCQARYCGVDFAQCEELKL